MIGTYLNSHLLVAHPSWPSCRLRLSLLLVSLSEHVSCYHAQPSILLFISMGRVSHLMPSLLSGWLLTNVQENNIIKLHDTHGHTYVHQIGITILLFFLHFFRSPWRTGWFPMYSYVSEDKFDKILFTYME
jgi:hypothetical protein